MIELTPVAAQELAAVQATDPALRVLRVYLAGKTCCGGYRYGLAFDTKAEADDTVIERSGIPVAMDPVALEVVRGSTIDFVDEPAGKGFVVRNPNAGGGCACGR